MESTLSRHVKMSPKRVPNEEYFNSNVVAVKRLLNGIRFLSLNYYEMDIDNAEVIKDLASFISSTFNNECCRSVLRKYIMENGGFEGIRSKKPYYFSTHIAAYFFTKQ